MRTSRSGRRAVSSSTPEWSTQRPATSAGVGGGWLQSKQKYVAGAQQKCARGGTTGGEHAKRGGCFDHAPHLLEGIDGDRAAHRQRDEADHREEEHRERSAVAIVLVTDRRAVRHCSFLRGPCGRYNFNLYDFRQKLCNPIHCRTEGRRGGGMQGGEGEEDAWLR